MKLSQWINRRASYLNDLPRLTKSKGLPAVLMLPILFSAAVAQAASQQEVANYVRDHILGGAFTEQTLWMTESPLNRSHVARDEDPAIPDVPFPYVATWLVMIDDVPRAFFSHPVRWLFVNDNLLEHSLPVDKTMPPTVFDFNGLGTQVPFGCAAVTPAPCPELSPPAFGAPLAAGAPAAEGQAGGDKDCLYALLVAGGRDNKNNALSFSRSVALMYQKLRQCGYRQAAITVYYDTNGTLDADNADLDDNVRTGSDEVDGSATKANIRRTIRRYCRFQGDPKEDVFFIYFTSHGSKTKGISLWDFNGNGKSDADEYYSSDELAEDTKDCQVCKLYIVVDTCFAGQFVGLATDRHHENTAVYAASTADEYSYSDDSSMSTHSDYMVEWFSKVPGETSADEMHPQTLEWSTPVTRSGTDKVGDDSICDCCTKVGDSAYGDGETYFSSSEWTKDGETIGETFPDGIVPVANSTEYATVGLQVPPNDWHGHVLTACNGQAARLNYTVENFAPDDQITLQILCPAADMPQPLTLHVDVGADHYTVTDGAAVVQAEGVWTGYPTNLPADFQITDLTRRNYVDQHCPNLCDPACPEYDSCACKPDCNPQCPNYDQCACIPDVCNPTCPNYDPCACAPGPCNPTCPEYAPCLCATAVCDPSCPAYDPCRCYPSPCNSDCPEFDPCHPMCGDPCDPQCQNDCQACCLIPTMCIQVSPTTCTEYGGQLQGSGTSCATSSCTRDCNQNGISDDEDVWNGTSRDCNYNYIPDECEPDGDGDAVIDLCDSCPNTVPGAPVDVSGCPFPMGGDRDRDGDIDTQDLAAFVSCAAGPEIPAYCADMDLDVDGDVDQSDFGIFQRCYSGEDNPLNPSCAD